MTLIFNLLTSQSRSFHATAPLTTCANLHQNQLIFFLQNIVFASLVTDERMTIDGQTNGHVENTMPPSTCQSGPAEAQQAHATVQIRHEYKNMIQITETITGSAIADLKLQHAN